MGSGKSGLTEWGADIDLTLEVPDGTGTVGNPILITTNLTNNGDSWRSDVTETFTFSREDGAKLAPTDMTYETQDRFGQWATLTLTEDGDDLTASEHFSVPSNLAATSQVRVTIRTAGQINGRSSIADASGEIAGVDYEFTVT